MTDATAALHAQLATVARLSVLVADDDAPSGVAPAALSYACLAAAVGAAGLGQGGASTAVEQLAAVAGAAAAAGALGDRFGHSLGYVDAAPFRAPLLAHTLQQRLPQVARVFDRLRGQRGGP